MLLHSSSTARCVGGSRNSTRSALCRPHHRQGNALRRPSVPHGRSLTRTLATEGEPAAVVARSARSHKQSIRPPASSNRK